MNREVTHTAPCWNSLTEMHFLALHESFNYDYSDSNLVRTVQVYVQAVTVCTYSVTCKERNAVNTEVRYNLPCWNNLTRVLVGTLVVNESPVPSLEKLKLL